CHRPACDPLGGFARYLALAVPSAVLACVLGVACGFVAPRRAGLVYAGVVAGSLAIALWPVVRGPQVFVFHHLGGMYPGPIYDEAISTSRALWLFRGDTLLYAGACAGIALIAGPPRPRRRGILALLACGVGAAWMSLQAEKLHWKAAASQLDAELGGRMETEHLLLHFPREKKDEERALLARDAENEVRAVAADWPPGEFTRHEEARALEDLHRLPDLRRLFRRGFFYAESGPRAYTAAGSFLRFVWETRGPAAFFRLYASPESIDLPS